MRNDGSSLPIMPFDLKVGSEVEILGKMIRLYDCDEYTRDFYKV